MLLTQKKKDDQDQEDQAEVPDVEASKEPVLERKESKVSFGEPVETRRKESYTGVTRVSFEKPADLYVTSTADTTAEPADASADKTADQPAVVEVKAAEASNTGTAKRKKKKRDEVCCKNSLVLFCLSVCMRFFVIIFFSINSNYDFAKFQCLIEFLVQFNCRNIMQNLCWIL